ncbi:MAG: WD40 repeat domain-containing protein [Rhodospirillales bacterium]|nr:WD40 repeat domain-containing protein [Rhodospirillales bacterium]
MFGLRRVFSVVQVFKRAAPGGKYPAVSISELIAALARLGVVAYFGLFTTPASAQIGFFLPSPPSALRQFFGDQVHSVACAGCTANRPFQTEKMLQLPYIISSLVWSPDGKYLAVGSLLESKVDIYDTSNWNLVSHIQAGAAGEGGFVNQFTSDSKYLIRPRFTAHGTDNVSIQKWNPETNLIVGDFISIFQTEKGTTNDLEGHDSYPKAVATSVKNNLVAAAVGGSTYGHILIYNSIDYHVRQDILCGFHSSPNAIAFSRDNRELATGGMSCWECSGGLRY